MSREVLSSDPRLFRWLQARRFVAEEMYERRRITAQELSRIIADANMGQYSGPIRFKDGSVSKDDQKVRELLGGKQ